MSLEEAARLLNAHAHRGIDYWEVVDPDPVWHCGGMVEPGPDENGKRVSLSLTPFEAISIAGAYLAEDDRSRLRDESNTYDKFVKLEEEATCG